MKLTKKQKQAILPMLQRAVQNKLDEWGEEGNIEGFLNKDLDGMGKALGEVACSVNRGSDINEKDVQDFIDACREV